MDFSTLQSEFYAHGFSDLNDAGAGVTRVKRWINEAYHMVCESHDGKWAFLETSSSGTAPVTVSDLKQIIHVTDSTTDRPLRFADAWTVEHLDPDKATVAAPMYYWLDGLSTLRVWPLNTTDTISIRYYKVPADLSANGDLPLVPTRYQDAILQFALAKAHRAKNNEEQARSCEIVAEVYIDRMRNTGLFRGDEPDFQNIESQNY